MSYRREFTGLPERSRAALPKAGWRGQMAMWILTKFAMLFFIFMLAALMVSLSGQFRSALCDDQARLTAQRLTNGVADVINSPLEDERKVLPLEAVLSAGKADFERYTLNITDAPAAETDAPGSAEKVQTGEIILSLDTNAGCTGGGRAPYRDFQITLLGGPTNPVVTSPPLWQTALRKSQTLTATPSELEGKRTNFIVVLKCTRKVYPPIQQLWVQSCQAENPARCIDFQPIRGTAVDRVASDIERNCNPHPT